MLFALLFVLDYVNTSAPAGRTADSLHTPGPTRPDSMALTRKGDIIKTGNSTRDVFNALADDAKTDTSKAAITTLRKQDGPLPGQQID